MKLVWHEFKTLTLHWKWFISLWWLLVLIDLGYQSGWWWEGPRSWIGSQTSHETVSMLARALIWIGLGLSTLIVFLGISPEQLTTASRLRPISAKGRLLSRVLFLTAFIGMPWWLHELYYLSVVASLSADHVALGVFERVLSTPVFWFLFGCPGWVSGTFTRAAQLAGISLAILVVLVKIDDLTNWLTHHAFGSPQHPWADWSRYGNWTHFVAAITLGSGLLFWLWRKNNNPSRSHFFTWFEFVIIVTASTTLHRFMILKSSEWLLSGRNLPGQDKAETLLSDLPAGQPFHIGETKIALDSWTIQPDFPETPGYFTDISEASGELTLSDGTQLSLSTQLGPNHTGKEFEIGQSSLKNYVAEFPEFLVFGYPHRNSDDNIEKVFMYPEGDNLSLESPDEFTSATANVHIDLLKRSEWHTLPLDGSTHQYGSLGKTKLTHRKGNSLYLLACPLAHYTSRAGALEPFRQFALINRKKKQLIFLSNKPRTELIAGVNSTAPFYELHLSIGSETPLSFAKPDWFKNAELLMMEAPLVGRVQKAFRTDQAKRGYSTHTMEHLYWAPEIDLASSKRDQSWSNPKATEEQVRRSVYEHVRARRKLVLKNDSIADQHRPFLRNLAMEHPILLGIFGGQWNDNDRDWFLAKFDETEGKAFSPEHINSGIAKEWLIARPEWVKLNLNNPDYLIQNAALEIAKHLGLEEGKKMQYRHSVWNFGATPVQRETYPEVWDEISETYLNLWKENHWALKTPYGSMPTHDLHLGRMGIQNPLRERLKSFLLMEPEYSENISGRFQHYLHGETAWQNLCQLFRIKKDDQPKTSEEKIKLAEKWLAAKWQYDPATMTYSLKP